MKSLFEDIGIILGLPKIKATLNEHFSTREQKLIAVEVIRRKILFNLGSNHELLTVFDFMLYPELFPYFEKPMSELIRFLRETSDSSEEATEKLSVQQKEILVKLFEKTNGTRETVRYSLNSWFSDGEKLTKKELSSFSRSLKRLEDRKLLKRKPIPGSESKRTCLLQFTCIGIVAASRLANVRKG
jgi:DNA-binding MarR family transcriptional regulator